MNCAEQIRANNPALDGWVRASSLERDLLLREHDKRVEEYIALQKLLPTTAERVCLAHAASLIAGTHSARVIARYLDRIAQT